MLSAFDLWILIQETRTLWVLIVVNVRLTEVNFTCACGSLWFPDSAVCRRISCQAPSDMALSPQAAAPHAGLSCTVSWIEGVHKWVWTWSLVAVTTKRFDDWDAMRGGDWAWCHLWGVPCPLRLHAFDCNMPDRIMECHSASYQVG